MTTKTDAEISAAIERLARIAQGVTPENIDNDDVSDLTALGRAAVQIAAHEGELRNLVAAARKRGRTWPEIGEALGVS